MRNIDGEIQIVQIEQVIVIEVQYHLQRNEQQHYICVYEIMHEIQIHGIERII